jgi:hypothetical protein
MKLTKDQKHALYIAGGAIALIVLFWLLNRGGINPSIPGTAISLPPSPDGLAGPGYMDYNVGGLNAPPSLSPTSHGVPDSARQACCGSSDGCFSSSPLDTGRGPITLDQLVGWYSDYHPGFTQYVQQAQAPYAVAPQTISEQAQPGLIGALSLQVPWYKRIAFDALY